MYQNVLIPTDGSAGVDESIAHGVAIAERFDATVHALYVVDERAPGLFSEYTHASFGENVRNEITSKLEAEGHEATSEVREAAAEAGLDAREAVVTGVPHEAIVDYAEENDIGLIVMGTHGRTGIGKYLLGSVTERVVRFSESPVLTVHIESRGSE